MDVLGRAEALVAFAYYSDADLAWRIDSLKREHSPGTVYLRDILTDYAQNQIFGAYNCCFGRCRPAVGHRLWPASVQLRGGQ